MDSPQVPHAHQPTQPHQPCNSALSRWQLHFSLLRTGKRLTQKDTFSDTNTESLNKLLNSRCLIHPTPMWTWAFHEPQPVPLLQPGQGEIAFGIPNYNLNELSQSKNYKEKVTWSHFHALTGLRIYSWVFSRKMYCKLQPDFHLGPAYVGHSKKRQENILFCCFLGFPLKDHLSAIPAL